MIPWTPFPDTSERMYPPLRRREFWIRRIAPLPVAQNLQVSLAVNLVETDETGALAIIESTCHIGFPNSAKLHTEELRPHIRGARIIKTKIVSLQEQAEKESLSEPIELGHPFRVTQTLSDHPAASHNQSVFIFFLSFLNSFILLQFMLEGQ